MSANKLKFNSGFCALPFIERFLSNSPGRYYCCYSSVPIENENLELETIYNGGKIKQCVNCYKLEENNTISPRQRETVLWLKVPEVSEYLENWSLHADQKKFFYDIRAGAKCNLACISCGPHDSTLWQKELGIEIKQRQLDQEDVNQAIDSKKIYMAGGEPFIIDDLVGILETVSQREKQPEIVINTNLTKIDDNLLKCLSKIKKLTLTISVDSYGPVNDYHRWPVRWDKFIRNLEFIESLNCYKMFNTVVDAISILNIGSLVEIEHYVQYWNLTIINRPQALSIANLPEHLKTKAKESVVKLTTSKFYSTRIEFKSKVNYILALIDEKGNSEDLSAFISTLDRRRKINHVDYLGVSLT
jgi:MoaA/NifB/PqqE/SkfB family radical SAM enzyme